MELCPSGLCIGPPILPPTEVEEDDEEDDDEDARDTPPETCPVKLKPGGSCRLVDDTVRVGLGLFAGLVGLTAAASHVFSVVCLVAERVTGPLPLLPLDESEGTN